MQEALNEAPLEDQQDHVGVMPLIAIHQRPADQTNNVNLHKGYVNKSGSPEWILWDLLTKLILIGRFYSPTENTCAIPAS
jgi:hypothetical protein